jgi:uncharacterized protein (DUF885 family)
VGSRRRWLWPASIVALLLVSHACARPPAGPTTPPPTLAEVVRSYDRDVTPYHPFTASEAGLRQYDRVLANDIGIEYRRGLQALCTRHRADLRRIEPAALPGDERLTYEILGARLDTCLDDLRFDGHLLPVNHVGQSWPSRFPVVGAGRGSHPFKTAQNYEDFLGRIDGFVTWMDTAVANMRAGAARGITHPRESVARLLPQLDAQIVDDPEASLFYEPLRNFPVSVDEETRRRLRATYVAAIRDRIVPAYRRMRDFVRDEYLPRARTSPGWSALPGGRAWYAHAVRTSTTIDLTPTEIYALGVAEVERIRAQMDGLRAEIAAAGEPELPRHRTAEDLLQGYAEVRTAVEHALPRLFGRLPRSGFEIRPIEPFRERTMPSSYAPAAPDGSRPGVFYLNAAEVRSSRGAPVYRNLFLHEAVPGHHLQIALQRENRALPGFRRFGWYVAFGEGWALYAESLGVELGVYPTRRDRLGMLAAELFRARRLVVDVGLHDRGWTRAQAIEFLGGPTPNNVREVERYMVWPGQALGYKIGQLRILALRKKAEAALGAAFDIRAFHDELLRDGAMPLSVLEAKMDRWLAAQARR